MRFQRIFIFSLLLCLTIGHSTFALACDVCGCPFNAKNLEGHGAGATATTPTANTLGRGHGSVGFFFEHQRYNSIPAQDAHELHEAGRDIHGKNHEEFYNLVAGYGVRDDLDLFLVVPWVSRTLIQIEDEDQLGRGERASGVGDLRLIGKYRFWDRGVDAAVLLGVKAPTGGTSEHDQSGNKFEPEQEPGSGSWDFTTGLAVSRSFREHWTLAGAFQYTYRGEGSQDFKFGDVFRYDLGGSYAFKPLGQHPNVSLTLDLQTQWANRDHNRQSDKVFDSGGTTVLLTPGLSIDVTRSVSAFAAIPIPVYQNLGGEHEELKYEVLSGISWHF